jgi:hypothetical protein
LNVSAHYQSDETQRLTLSNANSYLTIDDRNPGTPGIAGLCPVPQRIGRVPMNGPGHREDFALTFSKGWTSADRRKAKEAWDNGLLYVTCDTTTN